MGISYAFASDVVASAASAAPNAYTQRVGPKKFAKVEKQFGLVKLFSLCDTLSACYLVLGSKPPEHREHCSLGSPKVQWWMGKVKELTGLSVRSLTQVDAEDWKLLPNGCLFSPLPSPHFEAEG